MLQHLNVVIAGLDPAIHSVTVAGVIGGTEWMPGSSPGMTTVEGERRKPIAGSSPAMTTTCVETSI
jgi:hypothetical protein